MKGMGKMGSHKGITLKMGTRKAPKPPSEKLGSRSVDSGATRRKTASTPKTLGPRDA